MKTEVIKQQIITNFNQLSKLAHVEQSQKDILSTWGIVYKKGVTSGFVSQLGVLERNHSSVQIIKNQEIRLQKKTFFLTWKRALKSINKMLQNVIKNIDNEEVVTKRVVNILTFSEEAAKIISKQGCKQ